MAINDTGVLYSKFQSQFLNLYLLNLPSCYHTLFEQINASQMNDNYDNGTYFYKGEDDKRPPQNIQTIDYISNITSIKVYVMYGCDRILLVSYLDSIITIEFKAYYECDSIKHLPYHHHSKLLDRGSLTDGRRSQDWNCHHTKDNISSTTMAIRTRYKWSLLSMTCQVMYIFRFCSTNNVERDLCLF